MYAPLSESDLHEDTDAASFACVTPATGEGLKKCKLGLS